MNLIANSQQSVIRLSVEVSQLGYTFKCKDLGLNCDYQASADNPAEVAKQASAHAMQAHKAEAMTLASKIKDAVKKT